MGHDHHHQHPDVTGTGAAGERRLFRAMLLTGGFMIAEVLGGMLSGSLALIADAGHMFGDFVALVLAWTAFRLSKKSPDLRRSFGYHRFQVLAAFVNGLVLLGLALWIIVTAVTRLLTAPEVLAGPMLVIASLGLIVNLIVLRLLTAPGHESINTRAAALHVMGDLLGSVAAVTASVIIMLSGWMRADPLLSLVVAALIVRGGYAIVRESGHILLEGTPEEVHPTQVSKRLMALIPEILDVHHVHIWSLTDERPVLTLHARIAATVDHDTIMQAIHEALDTLFGVSHATVQLEYGPCTDDHKGH